VESVESQKQASPSFHEPLGNLAESARFPLSHRAGDGCFPFKGKGQNQNQKEGGLKAASLCMANRTDHVLIKPDNLKS
jgi:hypothetical protein